MKRQLLPRKPSVKKILAIGAAVTVGLLATYGLYKYSQFVTNQETQKVVEKNSGVVQHLEKMQSSGKLGDAKIHTSAVKGHAYNKTHLYDDALVKSLSMDERSSIKNYTGNGYFDINKLLRTGDKSKYDSNGLTSKSINDLTNTLNKSSLKEDVVVHRGIGGALPKMLGVDANTLKSKEFQNNLKGTVITEKGFFSSGGSMQDAWGGTKIHAMIPKGSKGMYVDPISSYKGEHEFILQRNSSFKIIDYVANDSGTITDVIVELIDQTVN